MQNHGVFPDFWNSLWGYILMVLNPILLGYKGFSLLISSAAPEIMGVFWNPTILICISVGLIGLFEIYRLIMKLVYHGVPLLIKISIPALVFVFISFCPPTTNFVSLIYLQEFIFTSPYLFISNGDILDAMFLYLIELWGIACTVMSIGSLYKLIINIVNKGWKYIMKILVLIISITIISIYPLYLLISGNGITDMLFAYLYELWALSIGCLILSVIFAFILKIIKIGWKYIRKILIVIGVCMVIVLLSYLFAPLYVESNLSRDIIASSLMCAEILLWISIIVLGVNYVKELINKSLTAK